MAALLCLTIAASDPSGGAGIQADLRTFDTFGVTGASAVTALTAQTAKRGVTRIQATPVPMLTEQLKVLASECRFAAIKIGVLCSDAQIAAVAKFLNDVKHGPVVWDPVVAPTKGKRFLPASAVKTARTQLGGCVNVVTPNVAELKQLAGVTVASAKDVDGLGDKLGALDVPWVLLKGGHLSGAPVDTLWQRISDDNGGVYECVRAYRHRRSKRNVHGSGCVLSSALTAELAKGADVPRAVYPAIAEVQRLFRTHG